MDGYVSSFKNKTELRSFIASQVVVVTLSWVNDQLISVELGVKCITQAIKIAPFRATSTNILRHEDKAILGQKIPVRQ